MERREAIRNTALLLGYAVSASTITAVLNGCTAETTTTKSEGDDPWAPGFFNNDEIALLDEMSEVILPATDTPGAREAEVYKYIDVIIGQQSDAVEQSAFRDGLNSVNEECLSAYGASFVECSPAQRLEYVKTLDQKTYAFMQDNSGGFRPFFARMKELTWIGFFTSELIGENYLNYDPVPGVYDGCIPLDDTGGKVWSL